MCLYILCNYMNTKKLIMVLSLIILYLIYQVLITKDLNRDH